MPRVSIVVPAYNFGAYVGDAIGSILAQHYADWECVVADDGSTDDTAAVVEEYCRHDSRVRLLRLPHGGVVAARNRAIDATTGNYLQFLDADDKLAPHKLAAQVRYLDEHEETGVVYGNVAYFRSGQPDLLLHSPGGKLSRGVLGDPVASPEEALRRLEHYNFVHITSALVRRQIVLAAGKFCPDTNVAEDYELWLSIAIMGVRFDHLGDPEPLAFIRTHESNASKARGAVLTGLIAAAHHFPQRPASRQWRRPALPAIYEVALGVDARQRGARREAFTQIWKAAESGTEILTVLRWKAYAVAAFVLPRALFWWFVTLPIPEGALESYRTLRKAARRVRGRS